MVPGRIPRVHRKSPDVPLSSASFVEADYCMTVRIWDLLLWFAIMQRPRRDVGICTDFANTLAECSMQLLPRSVFPFDLVPMTRLDPVERTQVRKSFLSSVPLCLRRCSRINCARARVKFMLACACQSLLLTPRWLLQVLMETQFDVDKYGGRIFRPAVIPRHINPGIATSNFKLECEGMIGTKVLEDEMYMSEIVMMAEDMNIKWNCLPIGQCPSLNIFWEYDVFYPMCKYMVQNKSGCGSSGDDAFDPSFHRSQASKARGHVDDGDDDEEALLKDFAKTLKK